MKLGKDEIQKIFLGGLLLVGIVYSYFDLLLFPLQKKQKAARATADLIGPQIKEAQTQIRRTQELESTAPVKVSVVKQVEALIPEGSPVAWFPPRVNDFLRRHGIEKSTTKLNGETPEKDLGGFRRLSWGIDLPKVQYGELGSAISALENEEPLLEITTLQIETTREDAESQHALITVQNLAKQ
ncbi:MAG TPA: hypothetical protein VF593_10850 [Chthoniobacteraceae bacterium]|jgi:hypothetical protein